MIPTLIAAALGGDFELLQCISPFVYNLTRLPELGGDGAGLQGLCFQRAGQQAVRQAYRVSIYLW
jgi:hypothetical protein